MCGSRIDLCQSKKADGWLGRVRVSIELGAESRARNHPGWSVPTVANLVRNSIRIHVVGQNCQDIKLQVAYI